MNLTPGSAALIMLVRGDWIPEEVLPHIHAPRRIICASLAT
jgi:hypothetical protein